MTEKELEKIYNETYRAVYWTAFSLLKNEDDAQDIVQDTYVALINSYDTIQDKSKILPWLKKVAANRSLNRLTRTKTDNVDDEFLENIETVPEDFLPDSIVESEATRKIIMDIINNTLSEDVRRTLILFYFDEMSTKEVAEALGIPEGTVSWRLNFAKKKIKKEVEKYEEENDTKLYGMVLPFLSKLFEKEAEMVPLKPMPASLLNLSASTKAAAETAAKNLAAQAAKKGTGFMMKKTIIGIVAGVIAVGAIAGTVIFVTSKKEDAKEKTKTKNTKVEETEDRKENAIGLIDFDDSDVSDAGEDPVEDSQVYGGYSPVSTISTLYGDYGFHETFGDFLAELSQNPELRFVIIDYDDNHYTLDDLDTVVTSRYVSIIVYHDDDRLFELDAEKVENTAIRDCTVFNFVTSKATTGLVIDGHYIDLTTATIDDVVGAIGDYYPRTTSDVDYNYYHFDLSNYDMNCLTFSCNDDNTIFLFSMMHSDFLY
ncbi:MAG: sigma-70 family RNA polymerase sigma factor [Clostridiales bacterium]|nr:sigma-70 family RNA polymerase sigma factor [Clostridiales bacterium]